jgi:hypothetical protein
MKQFVVRINNKAAAVKSDLTELIIFCYNLIDSKTVGMEELTLQEDSWKVDSLGWPMCGITRTVAFSRIDNEVKDGATLVDLSFFYPNPLLTNIGRN